LRCNLFAAILFGAAPPSRIRLPGRHVAGDFRVHNRLPPCDVFCPPRLSLCTFAIVAVRVLVRRDGGWVVRHTKPADDLCAWYWGLGPSPTFLGALSTIPFTRGLLVLVALRRRDNLGPPWPGIGLPCPGRVFFRSKERLD